jgi:hypothetical protein
LATPSPGQPGEIMVVQIEPFASRSVRRKGWQADLSDVGRPATLVSTDHQDRLALCDLIEKSLVMAMDADNEWWRLSNSTRRWYRDDRLACVDGIDVVSRLSFAALPVGESLIGVAFERGFLYRTEWSLADFFGAGLPANERRERRRWFDRLRKRREGRKGTLLYDTNQTQVSVCYFDHERAGVTCATTGRVLTSQSLLEYCDKKYPRLGVKPDDEVVYVSFPNMKGTNSAVPVAAKLLRLRVMPDGDPALKRLDDYKTASPEQRKADAEECLPLFRRAVGGILGCEVEDDLWQPSQSDHEALACPDLVFAQNRQVAAPSGPVLHEYQRYYRERPDRLRSGGVFRFEQTVARVIHVVTPPAGDGWPDDLQAAFLAGVGEVMKDLVGKKFDLVSVRAATPDEARQKLAKATPGTAVVVFDDTTDQSAYFLFAHHLNRWRLKRLTRSGVLSRWKAKKNPRQGDGGRAERRWNDMLFHSALDTLEQMDATPWRLKQMPYEACLTIDVSENRRYFAVSLMISRQAGKEPSCFRRTDVWTKADHQHESINARWLQDKVVEVLGNYDGPKFAPLDSLLVLRDGRLCGEEEEALSGAIDAMKKAGRLSGGAVVDIAEVHKKTVKGLRLWYPGTGGAENVLEGHAVYSTEDTALISCTGAATLSRNVTAEPCMLVLRQGKDVRKVAAAFFAMAQLNYASPNKAHRIAYPLWATDERLRRRVAQDMRELR